MVLILLLIKIVFIYTKIIKFEINKYIFNDISIEVLHKSEKCFKLLFIIQFNTFFINNIYSIKFSRDQIDSIHSDIRYPTDFFVDLHFDNEKEEKLSSFDEYTIYWKSLISELISKSLKPKNDNNNKINNDEIDIDINISDKIKVETNKDEEILETGNINNTVDKVNLLLKQLESKNEVNINKKTIEEDNNENNDDDEDIEKYLKSLESK